MNHAAPILLTPGPLTTSTRTRQAMMMDWGAWDQDFNDMTASVRRQQLAIIQGETSHYCAPMPGSGTFSIAINAEGTKRHAGIEASTVSYRYLWNDDKSRCQFTT
jgi:aspartate aminotransferase-like enzyme